MKVLLKTIFLCLVVCSTMAQSSFKEIKSALLFRLMHFTELQAYDNKYTLCVRGDDEIYDFLIQKVHNKPFSSGVVIVEKRSRDFSKCSVLYLGMKTKSVDKKILLSRTLTISSNKKIKSHSVIYFEEIGERVVFKANQTLMKKYKIKMSSKVLRLAREVF